jgi:hypothetical protein
MDIHLLFRDITEKVIPAPVTRPGVHETLGAVIMGHTHCMAQFMRDGVFQYMSFCVFMGAIDIIRIAGQWKLYQSVVIDIEGGKHLIKNPIGIGHNPVTAPWTGLAPSVPISWVGSFRVDAIIISILHFANWV